jgi:hypothetical protein
MSASPLPALPVERLPAGAARLAALRQGYVCVEAVETVQPVEAVQQTLADHDGAPLAAARDVRDEIDAGIAEVLASPPR